MPAQFNHSSSPVEFSDSCDDRLTLGPRVREPHGILEFVVGNINSRFHIPDYARKNYFPNLIGIQQAGKSAVGIAENF